MKVLYLGNFLHSWCSEVHISADARRIPGVRIEQIQEPNQIVSPTHWARFAATVATACDGADLLIYQRTWGLPPEAIDLWRTIEERGCKTISYHLDLYRGLKREAGVLDDPFWRTGVVFSADGDPATTAWLAEQGIDHRWMPAAIASGECVTQVVHQNCPPIVFVGSPAASYHDEWPWRGELLEGLSAQYGDRFFRWPTEQRGRLHGKNLTALYQSAACVVGDSLALWGHMNYWSDRFYETVGRGGYLIGPNVNGLTAHFEDGKHLSTYDIGNLDHVFELVDRALAKPERGREIARRGQEHVRAHHTYKIRVEAMLDSLGLTP